MPGPVARLGHRSRQYLPRALLYARTLRHLTPRQLVYRPLRRLQRSLSPPCSAPPTASIHSGRWPLLRQALLAWGPGDAAVRIEAATEVAAGRLTFLNQAAMLDSIDWAGRHHSHLWNYHLHYFDFAIDLAWAHHLTGDTRFLSAFECLTGDWIAGTAGCRGAGWEPYPISVRAVNWIYALLLLGGSLSSGARDLLLRSLVQQLAFLERRLEYDVLANHLLKNYQALAIGGLVFSGARAATWLRHGTRGLWQELQEQVLPDGGHFERSPMYHAHVLTELLQAVGLLDAVGLAAPWPARALLARMVDAFAVLSRPDGSLHLFNDAANATGPTWAAVDTLSSHVLNTPLPALAGPIALPDTGYYGYVDPTRGERLLVDCGPPGPTYQPGHAHCDLLSFELDLAGQPVIVDSGVAGYETDPLREYVRSTRAHNTVALGVLEQSEIWGTFRMARRARVIGARAESSGSGYRFTGAYVPYHSRSAVHQRSIAREGSRWTIMDVVRGAPGAPLTSYVHFHPAFELQQDGMRVIATSGETTVAIDVFGLDTLSIQRGEMNPAQGWYCPEFGKAVPAPVLEMRLAANQGAPFGYHVELVEGAR